jgi:hypothetical protein
VIAGKRRLFVARRAEPQSPGSPSRALFSGFTVPKLKKQMVSRTHRLPCACVVS